MSKKKKQNVGEQTRRRIRIDQLQQEVGTLKDQGKEEGYRPKIGRQISKLEKEIKGLK